MALISRRSEKAADLNKSLMLGDLAKSGLTEADAKRLRLKLLDPKAAEKLGAPGGRVAYRIPYLDPAGKDTGYFRLRFLTQLDGPKPLRYWQPSGSLPQLFFPPTEQFDLAATLKDPQEPLYVTEGEKKAYKACLDGLLTVGIGGVWSWKSKRADTASLAIGDLDLIEWRDRRVIVVFDSDVSTKPEVQKALKAFAKEVMARGARPYSVKLPAGPSGSKVGLDDFLVAEGRAAFDTLEPEPLIGRLADELWRLNEELVFVKDTASVWQFAHRRFLNKDQLNLAYGNRLIALVGERGAVTQTPVVKEWLKWGQRREAPRVVFEPAEAPELTTAGEVNLWRGWGCEPAPGSVEPWDDLLSYLFKGDDGARKWFEDWCAYPLQNPGAKLYSAAVLFSLRHGVGKSLVGTTLGRIYGDAYALLTQEDLASPFNTWAAARLFALGDEVTGSDKRRDADRFKSLVTRETVTVNAKFQPPYTLLDRLNYLFTTNHPDAFLLERGDRRFFVHEIRQEPLPRHFYDDYDKWMRGTGASHLFAHFLKRRLNGFNPREAPPRTDAKLSMIELGLSDLDGFAEQLREDPDTVLRFDGKVVSRTLFTLEELLAFADPGGARRTTRLALSKALRRAGFRPTKLVRTTAGVTAFWAPKDQDRWLKASHAELKDERERGSKLTVIQGGKAKSKF